MNLQYRIGFVTQTLVWNRINGRIDSGVRGQMTILTAFSFNWGNNSVKRNIDNKLKSYEIY
jgi:hypothetical protein